MGTILDTPAQPVNGERGTTDTAVLVRFPGGSIVPVGVQVGHNASEYLDVYNDDGCKVVGVRRGGTTIDFEAQAAQARREAVAVVLLCQTSGIWVDREERVPNLERARKVMADLPHLRSAMLQDADQLIAAYEGAA